MDIQSLANSVTDVDDEGASITRIKRRVGPTTETPRIARKKADGRKAFQGVYCEIHGSTDDGTGCAKFSNLRNDGLGIYRPSFWRFWVAGFTRLVKPLFLVSFAAITLYLGFHFVSRTLSIGTIVPTTTKSPMSSSIRPTSTNSVRGHSTVNTRIPGSSITSTVLPTVSHK